VPLSHERQIENLLYRYAECVDAGDFDGVSALFEHAGYHLAGAEGARGEGVGATMRATVQLHGGTPGTKHVMTNAIIELADDERTAEARSCFTVLQAAEGFPLQPVITGRYHDHFELVDGRWRFATGRRPARSGRGSGRWRFADRAITIEQIGDLSRHLTPGTL
jgi:3-phenylpropionate/cinnamic acid dioxygenase small subunit